MTGREDGSPPTTTDHIADGTTDPGTQREPDPGTQRGPEPGTERGPDRAADFATDRTADPATDRTTDRGPGSAADLADRGPDRAAWSRGRDGGGEAPWAQGLLEHLRPTGRDVRRVVTWLAGAVHGTASLQDRTG